MWPNVYNDFVELGKYFSFFSVLFASLTWLLRDAESKTDIACKLVSAAFAACISIYGLSLLLSKSAFVYYEESEQALEEHVYLRSSLLCISAYFVYDVCAMFNVHVSEGGAPLMADFVGSRPLITAHHLALALVFVPLTLNRLLGGHGCGVALVGAAYFMEASTPFVSIRAILAHNSKLRRSKLYIINGLLMMLVFFVCRILVFPVFVAKLARQKNQSLMQTFFEGTHCYCKLVALLFLLPQLHWFMLMVKGALKMVNTKSNNEGGRDGKEIAQGDANNNNNNNRLKNTSTNCTKIRRFRRTRSSE